MFVTGTQSKTPRHASSARCRGGFRLHQHALVSESNRPEDFVGIALAVIKNGTRRPLDQVVVRHDA